MTTILLDHVTDEHSAFERYLKETAPRLEERARLRSELFVRMHLMMRQLYVSYLTNKKTQTFPEGGSVTWSEICLMGKVLADFEALVEDLMRFEQLGLPQMNELCLPPGTTE